MKSSKIAIEKKAKNITQKLNLDNLELQKKVITLQKFQEAATKAEKLVREHEVTIKGLRITNTTSKEELLSLTNRMHFIEENYNQAIIEINEIENKLTHMDATKYGILKEKKESSSEKNKKTVNIQKICNKAIQALSDLEKLLISEKKLRQRIDQFETTHSSLNGKMENMKQLMLRANEHIQELKKKNAKYKEKSHQNQEAVALLVKNIQERWLPQGLLRKSEYQTQKKTHIDNSHYIGVDADLCKPICRIQIDKIYWCLFSVGHHQEDKLNIHSHTQNKYFWALQDTFIRKKKIKITNSLNRNEEISLKDGTVLPLTLSQTIMQDANQKFERQQKANSQLFQKTLQELTKKLENSEEEKKKIREEYRHYKVRAHAVLESHTKKLRKMQ